ncbi:Radical S-adenosyl methionine domain-containing protein 2 [Trichoderma ghanense]|uniref:Radical S-adenosyl methionine domain-containing protein 2 n=1 Tax=Trichoderma ghanense TaxID=65468 RepID=A0ABY2GUS0_9HYPO
MHSFIYLLIAIVTLLLVYTKGPFRPRQSPPISVNYHFSRKCNMSCSFCFHTATTSHIESPENAKRGLKLLKEAGMKKCNFAGGEPFLYPKFLGEMIDYCKLTLQLESVSVVSNGSLIKEQFLRQHGRNIDILAISCDSFDEATNIKIGRGSGNQVEKLYEIAFWCQKYNIKFKLNTVVNRFNHLEDMNRQLSALQPFRWKCFQVLIVAGENDSDAALRNAHSLTISDEEFDDFCQRHRGQASLVPEPNRLMARSYLILDEYMRFLDRNGKSPSESILKVGVRDALKAVFWDEQAFLERGGLYDWNKGPCSPDSRELEW